MKIIVKNKEINILYYNTFKKKLFGLMNVKYPITSGIVLPNCNCIHTFFMKQNIDVCFTDKENKIICLKENLAPNKIILPIKNVYFTYELPLNTVKYLKVNDYLIIKK